MTALIIPFVGLPMTLLFILGLILLYRRRLTISSTKELSGRPVILLAISYLLISSIAVVDALYISGDLLINYPIAGLCVFVVTIASMFFVKSRTGI
jgi:hypothetical protein